MRATTVATTAWLTLLVCRATDNEARTLQEQLGVYTSRDDVTLSRALRGYELARLSQVCSERIDRLRAITTGGAVQSALCARDAADVQADQVSFLILAYACCVNQTPWFTQNEARSLMCKVESLSLREKSMLLRMLSVDVSSMLDVRTELEAIVARSKRQEALLPEERERGKMLQGLVRAFSRRVLQKPCADIAPDDWRSWHVVDFEKAPRLVGCRGVTVDMGTAYLADWQLSLLIRDTHTQALTAFLKDCRVRFEEISRSNTAYYFEQYKTIIAIMHEAQWRVCPVVANVDGGQQMTAATLGMGIAQFAPLCIVRLAMKLRTSHHLVDKERVTLRLWLRAANVPQSAAIEWWQTHVPTEEDVRLPIAQAYAKQYACVGCPKIRASGLCPFDDTQKTMTTWCGQNMPSALPDIEAIMSSTPCALQRCGAFFRLRHGDGKTAAMTNPRNPAYYFANASRAGLQ